MQDEMGGARKFVREYWKELLVGVLASMIAAYILFFRKGSNTAATNAAQAAYLAQTPAAGSGSSGADSNGQTLSDYYNQAQQQLTQFEEQQAQAISDALATQNSAITQQQSTLSATLAQQAQTEQDALAAGLASIQRAIGSIPSGVASTLGGGPSAQDIATWAGNVGIPVAWGTQFVSENGHLPGSLPELQNWLNAKGYRNPSTGALNFNGGGGAPTLPSAASIAQWAGSVGQNAGHAQAFVSQYNRLPNSLAEWTTFRNAHGWAS